MNINRNNYEEFFLLYIDGELSAEEQKAVEAFAENNPDLKDELMLIEQTKLVDEDFVFDGKEVLFRTADGTIDSKNYEEHFLLYVDNELSEEQKKQTETFVLQHPQLQASFTTLKNTKLPVENIAYPNKAELYKEEKERPVIFMRFARIAAAAAIVGFGIWGAVNYNGNSSVQINAGGNGVTATTNNNATNTNVSPITTDAVTVKNTEKNIENGVTKTDNNRNTYEQQQLVNKQKTKNNSIVQFAIQKQNIGNNTGKTTPNKMEDVQPNKVNNNQQMAVAPTLKIKDPEAYVTPEKALQQAKEQQQLLAQNQSKANNVTNAHQVVYKVLDTDDEETKQTMASNTNNKSNPLYIGSAEVDGKKISKFFKKAGKILNSSDDDNVKIASFAISKSLQ